MFVEVAAPGLPDASGALEWRAGRPHESRAHLYGPDGTRAVFGDSEVVMVAYTIMALPFIVERT